MEPSLKSGGILLNPDLVRTILVGFIRDTMHTSGFQKAILGLSGGVDSSLVAHLAAEALGPSSVIGIIMPYKTSSPRSRADAELVATGLGIRTEMIDISPMVDEHLRRIDPADKVRRGNIMARERMIVLYDVSSREKGLVVGTSNKTESLLGYGTLFGDTACALNPLGDLYKTQVWQLADAMGVPQEIVEKKPSADLWEGQTDEHELGFSYREVDKLLFEMIDHRHGDGELARMGFETGFVQRVRDLVRKNQFKRLPPVVAKISNRTINQDFRYPRDWGV
jgi:NAD+ synthase